MIRYISKFSKDKAQVIQLEVREVSLLQDPSLAWRLGPGEQLFEVVAPKSLAGERYYSYFLFQFEGACRQHTVHELTQEAVRTAVKSHTEVDTVALLAKQEAIEIVFLEGQTSC